MTKLSQIKKKMGEFLVLKDDFIFEVIFGTIINNGLLDNTNPIWLLVVGVSSGGKTSLVAPFSGINIQGKRGVRFCDDCNEKSFLSGFKIRNPVTQKMEQVSMLHEMDRDGHKNMIFSDFSSILSKNPLVKNEILTQFRLINDGDMSKYTGTGAVKPWKGRQGFLGCGTASVYRELETAKAVGERFTYYWLDQPSHEEIIQKQFESVHSSKEITAIMQPFYNDYYNGVWDFLQSVGMPETPLTSEQEKRVQDAVIFCVKGKVTVDQDFRTGRIIGMPNEISVGRDNKSTHNILKAVHLMDAYEKGDRNIPIDDSRIAMIEKISFSAITRERRKILEILASTQDKLSGTQVGNRNGLGLDNQSIQRFLTPLHAVGLIQKDESSNPHKFFIHKDKEKTREFILRASKGVREPEQTSFDVAEVEEEGEPWGLGRADDS